MKTALKLASISTLSLAVLAAPAFAQSKVVTHFTPANVMKVMGEIPVQNAAIRSNTDSSGKKYDTVSFEYNGVKHVALLVVCPDAKGCLGLKLLTIWADAAKNANRVTLNNFNAEYGFGKGFIGPNNTVIFERYTISDGGVTTENVKANITNFIGVSASFEAYMRKGGQGTEASLKPGDAAAHAVSAQLPADTAAVVMSVGESQGFNTITIPAEVAPVVAPSKPAQ